MRIVSKKKDYYDSVQGTGQDFDVQYIRTEIEEPLEPFPFAAFGGPQWGGPDGQLSIEEYVIGFCGKVYPCLHLKLASRPNVPTICHALGDVDAFFETSVRNKLLKARHLDEYQGHRKLKSLFWYMGWQQADFQRFFGEFKRSRDADLKYFSEKRVPIFVVGYKYVSGRQGFRKKGTITYNALLRPHEFMRVFDPYTAFQELQMYLANMAMPDRPIPELSNDDLAHSKGHGDKYSFRKPPGK